jgi:3-hydroxyisobutyrate dehydrogenase-like beta-hydroxyacid dehydrogenase
VIANTPAAAEKELGLAVTMVADSQAAEMVLLGEKGADLEVGVKRRAACIGGRASG